MNISRAVEGLLLIALGVRSATGAPEQEMSVASSGGGWCSRRRWVENAKHHDIVGHIHSLVPEAEGLSECSHTITILRIEPRRQLERTELVRRMPRAHEELRRITNRPRL